MRRICLSIFIFWLFLAACGLASAQTTTVPFAPPHVTFLDTLTGKPLAGGTVSTFQAGTSTPLATFTDSSGGFANPTVITLGLDGGANIWLGSKCYKFIIKNSSGVLEWTADFVCATNLGAVSNIVSSNCSASLVAGTGFIKMCNSDLINWRNIANSADIGFAQAGIASTATGNLNDVLQYGTISTGGFQAQRYLDFSAAPAQSGVLATGNNLCALSSRNAAGSGDVCGVKIDSSNITNLGGTAGVNFAGPFTSNVTSQGWIGLNGNTNLPAAIGIGAGITIAGGFGLGPPAILGKIYIGDGTGYEVDFAKRTSSTDTTLFKFKDSGLLETNKLQVDTGINNNGAGLQHVRQASCTTPASANASCSTTLNWPGTWADTNYTTSCMLLDGGGNDVRVENAGTKTTTTMIVQIVNGPANGNASNGTVNCIGIHD